MPEPYSRQPELMAVRLFLFSGNIKFIPKFANRKDPAKQDA